MNEENILIPYWKDGIEQKAEALRIYFKLDAVICWQDTNEKFSVDEFIRTNCEYPGNWKGGLERIETFNEVAITVNKISMKDSLLSFHVVSFFTFEDEKIKSLDEY